MIENSEKLAISVPETAKVRGVSGPTAYELTRRADCPAFRIGRWLIGLDWSVGFRCKQVQREIRRLRFWRGGAALEET